MYKAGDIVINEQSQRFVFMRYEDNGNLRVAYVSNKSKKHKVIESKTNIGSIRIRCNIITISYANVHLDDTECLLDADDTIHKIIDAYYG